MEAKPKTRRVFFALWPDDQVRWALAEVQRSLPLSGRPVKPVNLHITLAFVGNVEEEQMQGMAQAAGQVSNPAFSVAFDRLGYFRKPQILWLGASRSPEALYSLQRSLSDAIAPFGYEAGQDFRPHITLARKSRPLPQFESHHKVSPVFWQVNQFALVESQLTESGPTYSVLRTYDLK
jgi:2'-5' RNA ligase